MILTLGGQGLNHDRARVLTTLAGTSLSILLVAVQLGMIAGFAEMISGAIDHAQAGLWIVPPGTAAFDDSSKLGMDARYAALQVAGVAKVSPVVVGFAEWRTRAQHTATVVVIGAESKDGALAPWNVRQGNLNGLDLEGGVVVDTSYRTQLGIDRLGERAVVENVPVRVVALSSGIRSFTTSPYLFTSLGTAREILGLSASHATYLLVKLADRADTNRVRTRLTEVLPRLEILTTDEFRRRNLSRWLLETGAGAALLGGALLGFLVGCVIVTQTLHASIRENIKQLATLRAMGASDAFMAGTVACHAALNTGLAALLAATFCLGLAWLSSDAALPIHLSKSLTLVLAVLVCAMSTFAALAALRKVLKLEPVEVLAQ
ncbi:MAG: ABC transporter permease [Hyphomicrobiaceae bacterium]